MWCSTASLVKLPWLNLSQAKFFPSGIGWQALPKIAFVQQICVGVVRIQPPSPSSIVSSFGFTTANSLVTQVVGKSPFLLKTRKMRAVQSRLLRQRAKRGRTCSIDHPYKNRALVSLMANVLEENNSFCQTYNSLILLNFLSTSSYEGHGHNAISMICYPAAPHVLVPLYIVS